MCTSTMDRVIVWFCTWTLLVRYVGSHGGKVSGLNPNLLESCSLTLTWLLPL
jgi:hypothetical protein